MTRVLAACAYAGLAWACLGATLARAQVPLDGPRGLLFDKAGLLWVANSEHNQVIAYDVTQTPPAQVKVIAQDLSFPTGLANFKGDIYVTNTESRAVTVYDIATGAEVLGKKIKSLSRRRPSGVAVDTKGDVYVANVLGDSVDVYSPSGALLGSVTGDGMGPFKGPTSVTIAGGSLFLSLEYGNSVREYPVAGFLSIPLTPSLVLSYRDDVNHPTGVSLSRDHRRLLVANSLGADVTEYRLPRRKPAPTIIGEAHGADGIAVAPNGWIYVSSFETSTISVYTSKGVFITSF